MMEQSTDTTQVMPLADAPQAQLDPDATVTMPVVQPVAPAVPVVPPQPPFDAQRAHQLHVHRVLGRILSTPSLPLPSVYEGHLYSTPALMLFLGVDDSITAYQQVFGGELTTEERDSYDGESRAKVDTLITVIDGLDVSVMLWTYLPAAEKPAPEPAVVVLDETPATEAEPVAAAEPEPQHDPAPAPQPETPVEHPEAA